MNETNVDVSAVSGERPARRSRGSRHPRNRVGGALAGLVLVTIGVLLALKKLDVLTVDPLRQLWPLALIVIGAAKLFGRTGRVVSGWGLWLVLVGFWFLALNFEVLGASRGLTGPVIVVLTGLVLVLKSFDGQPAVGTR